jgi:hypothetical protein
VWERCRAHYQTNIGVSAISINICLRHVESLQSLLALGRPPPWIGLSVTHAGNIPRRGPPPWAGLLGRFTANQFNDAGWTTQVTKASGDQAADVKVWRGSVDAVVQCKWYQNAVGNKAVPEIVAARTHYGVRHAIVVSKSGYTEAARELANTNDVWLIHHDEIPDLYGRHSASLDPNWAYGRGDPWSSHDAHGQ